jgi:hypothetical protein
LVGRAPFEPPGGLNTLDGVKDGPSLTEAERDALPLIVAK